MQRAVERLNEAFAAYTGEILADGGLGDSWEEALRAVPPELLHAEGGGTAVLARLREFWSQQRDLRPALAATRALLWWNATHRGSDHPDTLVELSALGTLALRAGRDGEGGPLVERAWLAGRGPLTESDVRLAVLAQNVARWWVATGRLVEAEAALALAHRIRANVTPDEVGVVAAQRAEVLMSLARPAEALPLLESALISYQRMFGPDHPATVARTRALGTALNQLGRVRQAVPLWRTAWKWLGENGDAEAHASVALELGVALESLDERAEALRMIESAVRWTRQAGTGSQPHPTLPVRATAFANAELRRGRTGVAEGLLREALEAERRLSGDSSAEVAERYAALGALVARVGRVDEALGWFDTAASLLRSQAGDADPRTQRVVDSLVGLLLLRAEHALASRDVHLARVALGRAWELAPPVLGFLHAKTRKVRDLRDRHRLT